MHPLELGASGVARCERDPRVVDVGPRDPVGHRREASDALWVPTTRVVRRELRIGSDQQHVSEGTGTIGTGSPPAGA